jgi:Concanavalin A-like lectin/glucanases superfamily
MPRTSSARAGWRHEVGRGVRGGAGRVLAGLLVLAVSAAVTAAVVRLPGSAAAFTATVTGSSDTAASNEYFTCRAAALGGSGTRAILSLPLTDASGPTAADISGNNYFGTYSASGVAYQQPGPCPRDNPASTAVSFDGTGSIAGPNGLYGGPHTFSVEVWFRTSTAAGKLVGFGSSVSGPSTTYDRHLYINSFGRLVFGVFPGSYQLATTPSSVVDGQWHLAAASLSAAGMLLYLDGDLVASNPAATTARAFSGYVRIGYDSLAGWPDRPTSDYFTGSLAYADVYLYALSAGQVRSHYLAGR